MARKLVAYLMAVDRGRCHFLVVDTLLSTAGMKQRRRFAPEIIEEESRDTLTAIA